MSKENHKTRLMDYLQSYGSITSLEAIRDLGNTRLSATIYKLRDKGVEIETDYIEVSTRWGSKARIAKYKLISV